MVQKLVFPEKLLQSGKGAGGDALQRRLKTLHEKLKVLEQEEVDVKSLNAVKQDLTHTTISLHKDKGVKAYAACCLADMLRLYAPDAPYTNTQLRDIFSFMIRQVQLNLRPPTLAFPTVKGKSSTNGDSQTQTAGQRMTEIPYYNEYLYLLESLATIKSVCLVVELDNAANLVRDYFEGLFSIVRPDMNKNLLRYIQDILICLIEESAVVPEAVLDILLLNVETFAEHTSHHAFILATTILQQQSQKLQRYLHTYFTEITERYSSEDAQEDASSSAQLDKTYALVVTLFRFCPDVLNNVIAVLEEQAQGDNSLLRVHATKTLGQMFGLASTGGSGTVPGGSIPIGTGGFGALMGTNQSTWRAWFGRRADKNVAVRLVWVEGAGDVLVNHLEMRAELEAGLRDKLSDPEEKVRSAVCKLVRSLDYESALHHMSVETLRAVGERMGDKRPTVSRQAFQALGALYSAAYPEIENQDALAIAQFSWIPGAIINSVQNAGSYERFQQVRTAIATDILPLPAKADEEKGWVERLLVVCQYLDETTFVALMSSSNLKAPGVQPWHVYLDLCEKTNGKASGDEAKESETKLERLTLMLSKTCPDANVALANLRSFAELNDQRLFKLFKSITDLQVDLKTLIKAKAELLRRLKESLPEALDTFEDVCFKASLSIINRSTIPHLLKRLVRPGASEGATSSVDILRFVSKHCPALYQTHIGELQVAIGDTKHFRLAEAAMQALASACRYESKWAPTDKRTLDRALALCSEGTRRQAKFAARFLANAGKPEMISKCIKSALQTVDMHEEDNIVAAVAVLAELAKSANKTFEARGDEIIDSVTNQVLMVDLGATEEEQEQDIWVDEAHLEVKAQAKILAVKLYVNRCLACTRSPNPSAIAGPHIKSLLNIVLSEGRIAKSTNESGAVRAHIRLRCASGLLKMAGHSSLDRMIDNQSFENIAMTIQDISFKVRYEFLSKLSKMLQTRKLSPRWNMVPILSAHDPEAETRELGIEIVTRLIKQTDPSTRVERLDRPFVRLLSMLAHHPDIESDGTSQDDVVFMAKYISLYVDHLVNQDNISLIYHLSARLRSVKDKKEANDKLYILSELAQIVLRLRAKAMGWVLSAYPGKEVLPRDIFQPLPSPEVAREIAKRTYLSEEAETWLTTTQKKPVMPKPQKRPPTEPKAPKQALKRGSDSKGRAKNKRRKKDEDVSEDDEEVSGEDDSEDESDGEEQATKSEVDPDTEMETGEPILGRGGRRNAKQKQTPPKKAKGKGSSNGGGGGAVSVSDLTEMDE